MANTTQLEWHRMKESYDGAGWKDNHTYRAEVPGGWLVAVCAGKPNKRASRSSVTFVPDVAHAWAAVAVEETPAKKPEKPKKAKKPKKPKKPNTE